MPEAQDSDDQPKAKSTLADILPEFHNEQGEFHLPTMQELNTETGTSPQTNLDTLNAVGATIAGGAIGKFGSEVTPKDPLSEIWTAHQANATALEDAAADLQKAQEEAKKHGVFTPSGAKTPEGKLVINQTNLPPAQGKAPLTPKGGNMTFNYGKEMGLTDYDAAQAVDMSKQEQGAWDVAKKAREAEKKIGPGWAMDETRANLMLPTTTPKTAEATEARKALTEAMAKFQEAKRNAAVSQIALEKVSGKPLEVLSTLSKPVKEGVLSATGRLAAKIPGALTGAYAGYDAYQAEKDREAGNYGRMAAHGLSAAGGALSMASDPRAKAVGFGMQVPAMGVDLLDMFAPSQTKNPVLEKLKPQSKP